jgi:hypothetical protein
MQVKEKNGKYILLLEPFLYYMNNIKINILKEKYLIFFLIYIVEYLILLL